MDMLSPEAEGRVETCRRRRTACLAMASDRSLEVGGPHIEQTHCRLTLACAEVCRTHAHVTVLGSPHLEHIAPEGTETGTTAEFCATMG